MEIHHAIIYGIVQGIAEFLPISSSAHLALLPNLMNIEDPGPVFDLFMHLGTLIAVCLHYRKEICRTTISLAHIKSAYLMINIIIAFIATVMGGFFIMKYLAPGLRSPMSIGINLIIFGVLMWVADRYSKNHDRNFTTSIEKRPSLLIGFAQALAIVPGVSRSGITLTIARITGFTRERSASFVFLLSIPTIIGGILEALVHSVHHNYPFEWRFAIIGIITSFIFGYLAIAFFLKILNRYGLLSFMIYRVVVGSALIIFSFSS